MDLSTKEPKYIPAIAPIIIKVSLPLDDRALAIRSILLTKRGKTSVIIIKVNAPATAYITRAGKTVHLLTTAVNINMMAYSIEIKIGTGKAPLNNKPSKSPINIVNDADIVIGISIEASQIKFNMELCKAIKNIVNTRTTKK